MNLPEADATRGRFGMMRYEVAAVSTVERAILRVISDFSCNILGALFGGDRLSARDVSDSTMRMKLAADLMV